MNRNKRFLANAMLLSVVSVIIRGITVSFNAYINKKIGAECMGLFTLVMSVYSFALTVALSCVNLSAVRLTSERCALLEGADRESWKYAMRRVVRAVSLYALLFGVLAGMVLFSLSDIIAGYLLKDHRTLLSLRVLACSLPAISLSSALSGYFTGLRKAVKNAAATVLEQFMKIIITSTALVMVLPGNVESACLAVVGGSAVAEAWSLAVHILMYLSDSGKPADQTYGEKKLRLPTKFKEAAAISLPSAIGTYARQGLTTLEHLAIPAGLRKNGLSGEMALASYGLLQGIAFPLVMFPYAVIGSFTSLLVPEMAERHELGDRQGIANLTKEVYHYAAIFSFGACGIFVNYAGELGRLVYNSEEAAVYTLMLGLLVPFMYLDTAVDALLKGLGEQVYIMKVNILDAAGGLLFVLLTTSLVGIYGYILTIWICELGNLYASIRKLGKITGEGLLSAIRYFCVPFLTTIFLGIIKITFLSSLKAMCSLMLYASLYILIILWVETGKKQKRKRPAEASLC